MLKAVSVEALRDTAGIDKCAAEIHDLNTALEKLREEDTAFVHKAIAELLGYANGDLYAKDLDIRSLAHNLLQVSGYETRLDFDLLAAATATTDVCGDITLYSPFISSKEKRRSDLLHDAAPNGGQSHLSQATLSIVNIRKVQRLLKELKQKAASGHGDADRVRKEISSQSDNLAAILANRRHYAKPAGQGVYEVDPRFLLFEYCHGLLLRESQVSLVHRLLGEVEAGRSVCHQMIMGAGKTTVVGPLLSMLANASTLVFEVVPNALLDFSAGVLRERFGAAIRKPIFTFTFDRYNMVTPQLLAKLRTARNLRAVVVSHFFQHQGLYAKVP